MVKNLLLPDSLGRKEGDERPFQPLDPLNVNKRYQYCNSIYGISEVSLKRDITVVTLSFFVDLLVRLTLHLAS